MFRLALLLVSLSACSKGKAPPADHCGEITTDELWSYGVHNVTCTVDIRSATVTVEAGSELVVSPDAGVRIGCEADGDSTLVINGTEEEPVAVKPLGATGSWTYLYFCDHAVDSELHWTTIEGAGAYDNVTTRTSVVVDTNDLLVDHVDIVDSAGIGFTLVKGGSFAPGSTSLTVVGATDRPGLVEAEGAGGIPADGSYTGNGDDTMELFGDVATSQTWAALDVPWFVSDHLTVGGTETTPAELTLLPGVELVFASGEGLDLGRNASIGSMSAVGTAEAPIRFRGTSETAGAWMGITLSENSGPSTFDYVDVGFAAIGFDINEATPVIDHASIHDADCGLGLHGDDAAPVLGAVTYANNGEDVCIYP